MKKRGRKSQEKSRPLKTIPIGAALAKPSPTLTTVMVWVAGLSALIGVTVRLVASCDDLWFDEVWTLNLIHERVNSVADIFAHFKHDNNHHLSSLWMWLVGQEAAQWVYRLPSALMSAGTIMLAGLIGSRRSRLAACTAITLFSWSYLLVHFGTETRGYAGVVFFTLLAWYALLQFEEKRSWRWAMLFWAATVLGFMSHLEFAFSSAALGLWAFWQFSPHRPDRRRNLVDLARLSIVPAACLFLFYFVSIRGVERHGGPTDPIGPLLIKTASLMGGGPRDGHWAWLVAGLTVAITCAALCWLVWRRDNHWLFFIALIASPLILVGLHPQERYFVRYFLVSVTAGILLSSLGLAEIMQRRRAGLIASVILLGLFAAGNAVNIDKLLRYGRGQYRSALRFMEDQSGGRDLVVTSDNAFRNERLVNYHKRALKRPNDVYYLDAAALKNEYVLSAGQAEGPEWFIAHRFDVTGEPKELIGDIYGNRYQVVCLYQYSDLSGWDWIIYRNANRPPLVEPIEPFMR